ncbi:23435_t:CDS:2, partial [Gigaspora margarita]
MKIYTFSKIIHRFPTQLNHQQNRTVSSTRENDRNFKDRLQKLKGLFDEVLINVEVYKEAQSDLLKSFIRKVPDSIPNILEYKEPDSLLFTSSADWNYQEAPNLREILKRSLTRLLFKPFIRKLPDILEYKEPLSLLSTKGADWDYQKAPELREILKSWLTEFFDAYKNGKREKKNSPLFTIMGGAGIGKSRLLTELPQIARSAVDNDELKKRLDNALVFNISFENGTAYDPDKDKGPLFAIGTRMLWQLQRRPKMMFPEFQENPKHKLDPNDIIRRIARSKNQNPSDLTVFLLLDGVHQLIENSGDGFNKNSKFYSLLIGMSINIIASKSFIIGCCSTTSMKPMRDALARTSQLHIQLPIPQLKAPSRFHRPVFNMEKPFVNILVEDMGGNGRALEALEEVMPSNIDDSCVIDIIHELLNRLEGVYSDVLDCSGSYKELLRVILSNTPLSIHYPVP